MMRLFAHAGLIAIASGAVFGQSTEGAAAAPKFELSDVHVSPLTTSQYIKGPFIGGSRYEIRTASMLDLIRTAWSVDPDKVLGGPSWLDTDRFDVIGKIPAGTNQEKMKLMLRTLLAERFGLVVHNDTKPIPAYALTVGKKVLMKEADGSGEAACKPAGAGPNGGIRLSGGPGETPAVTYECRNMTTQGFADAMRTMIFAPQYLNGTPVVDQTGLKGAWNFDIKYSLRGVMLNGAASAGDTITLSDAVDKQLGLKLEMTKIPMPVIVVDSVNQKPKDNPPGVTEAFPALPTEFDVAEIKLTDPDFRGGRYQIQPGGRVNMQGMTMQFLLQRAFAGDMFMNSEQLVGLPKWADTDRFDIVAKAPTFGPAPEESPDGKGAGPAPMMIDMDSVSLMLRKLLIDRFQLKFHYEERPVAAYTLTASKPKLKKADPSNRTGFHEGPGPDGKDPRIANPAATRLVTCQNMTMAQFAENLPRIASGYVGGSSVLDATGIEGAFDFTINFSGAGIVNNGGGGRGGVAEAGGAGGGPGAGQAADPGGGITLQEALEKQLGLKLETTKRPGKVLVIDHLEEKPTDN